MKAFVCAVVLLCGSIVHAQDALPFADDALPAVSEIILDALPDATPEELFEEFLADFPDIALMFGDELAQLNEGEIQSIQARRDCRVMAPQISQTVVACEAELRSLCKAWVVLRNRAIAMAAAINALPSGNKRNSLELTYNRAKAEFNDGDTILRASITNLTAIKTQYAMSDANFIRGSYVAARDGFFPLHQLKAPRLMASTWGAYFCLATADFWLNDCDYQLAQPEMAAP